MKKVLICDEEPIFSKLIRQEIKLLNYKVFVASDGREGLRIIRQEKPDILITDIFLPQINGLEFISLARKENPDISIIVFGDARSENLIEQVFRLGANNFIAKPFDPDRIATQIRRVSNRHI